MKRLEYGDIVKAYMVYEDCTDTVMLVNNITAGTEFNCLVLDLDTKEIIVDCRSISEFQNNYEVTEKLGNISELVKKL